MRSDNPSLWSTVQDAPGVSRRSMLKAAAVASVASWGTMADASRAAVAAGPEVAANTAAESSGAVQRFQYVAGYADVPLNMVRTGNPDGPQILFLHGFAHSYLVFKRQLESELAERFDLVAFDHRGHGNSGKPWDAAAYQSSQIWADDVAAIIAAAGNRNPTVVAWSYGTTVLCDYVRHHGIDSICAANFVGSLGGLVARARPPTTTESASVAREKALSESPNLEDTIAFAEFAMARYATPNMTPADREAHIIMNAMTPPYVQKAVRERDRMHLDVREKLRLPVLFSRGDQDWIISAGETAQLTASLPRATQSVYAGVGHMPFIHEPGRFNTELTAFALTAATGAKA